MANSQIETSNAMRFTKLPDPDITIDITKELQQLQEYKEQIGTPAERKNEQLNYKITTLQLQLKTYSNEVDKLKHEKNDLAEDLQTLNQSKATIDVHRQSLQHNDKVLEKLENYYEESQRQIKRDAERIKDLERENKQLSEENQQYELILDKLEREEISLKDKIHKESQQLRDLKDKYDALNIEYHTEKAFAKHTSVVAQSLQSEVEDLRETYETTLETINSDPSATDDYTAQKTLRFAAPQTMRLANIDSGSNSFAKFFEFEEPQLTDLDRNSAHWKRLSLLNSQSQSVRFTQYVEYDDTERTILSDEEQNGNDDMKEAKDYGYDDVINEMKQQLRIEYDDMLGKEKGKLIEKHNFEIDELNQQIVKYKKQVMGKNIEINRWKSENINGVKNGRNQFHQRPNNQPDLSKCKVFGWSVW